MKPHVRPINDKMLGIGKHLNILLKCFPMLSIVCPDSSEVEHLHGKQAVVGSIPILGKVTKQIDKF